MKIDFMGKTCDSFSLTVIHDDGSRAEYDGYPPDFLGGGDEVALVIDVDTGKIVGWNAEEAREWIRQLQEGEL